MTRARATLSGIIAIVLWGALALLTAMSGAMPPFQMTAITFAIAAALGISIAMLRGRADALRPTLPSFLLGLYGFFFYHACYFAALKLANPAEAQLIASLWALLIVLMSALLPGHRLRANHVIGALIGLFAAGLLIWPRLGATGTSSMMIGFMLAAACALIWSSYSVASRLVANVATESLAITCAATALLALLCHWGWETTQWPTHGREWIALIGLGVGPVGAAFFLWHIGMKQGDVSLLGALSYAAPVMSTGLLVLAGFAAPTWTLAVAVLLMVTAAIVATRERG
ncbi:MAG: aromatic amino acid exporter YddG [Beijerinckiaceae bacterium]